MRKFPSDKLHKKSTLTDALGLVIPAMIKPVHYPDI